MPTPTDPLATLSVGEVVVHPTFGLCRIHAIKRMPVMDGAENCYVFLLGPSHNSTKVFIPIAKAKETGLRRPMTSRQAEKVLQAFQDPTPPISQCSKEKLDGLSISLKEGDLIQAAETVSGLATTGVDQWEEPIEETIMTSRRSGAQALLTQILGRLIDELAYAQHVSHKTMEEKVRKCLIQRKRLKKGQTIKS